TRARNLRTARPRTQPLVRAAASRCREPSRCARLGAGGPVRGSVSVRSGDRRVGAHRTDRLSGKLAARVTASPYRFLRFATAALCLLVAALAPGDRAAALSAQQASFLA